jgi:DNA-binding NtrC family response regulator
MGTAASSGAAEAESAPGPTTIEDLGRAVVALLPDPQDGVAADDVFRRLEAVMVAAAIERTGGNKQAAAQILGVYRPRLYSMLRKHNLLAADEQDAESIEGGAI